MRHAPSAKALRRARTPAVSALGMPQGKKLAGGDRRLEWEVLPDDVFVPRRGRGRVDLAGAMARRFGARKRHRPARDAFIPRRVPRTRPPADPSILVVSSRVREPRFERTEAAQRAPATWDGVWDAASAAAAVRDHDTGVSDPTEVFAAHLASGWTLRPRRGSDGNRSSPFPTSRTLDLVAPRGARAEDARDDATDQTRFGFDGAADEAEEEANERRAALDAEREAFGLKPAAPRDPKDARATRPIARAIARLCGGVSAARLGGVTCRDRRWCQVGLDEAEAALARLAELAVSRGNAQTRSGAPRRAAAAAADLAAGATLSLREAACALREDAERVSDVSGGRSRGDAPLGSTGSGPDDAFARATAAMGAAARGPSGETNRDERVSVRVTHRGAIALACALDEAWFQVAYHARACGWCDPADVYGYGSGETEKGATRDAAAAYFAAAENARRSSLLERRALVEDARRDPNPFAAVLRSRLREGARLFARAREEEAHLLSLDEGAWSPEEGVGERAVVAAAEAEKKTAFSRREDGFLAAAAARPKSKRTPERDERERTSRTSRSTLPAPPCPPLTRAWRDACRSWPCRLYAFAAPTDAALRALKRSATRWLEVGAGTGYWAAQMRRMGMDVVALDTAPPGEGTHNTYHGSCAPWHPVERGDAAAARAAGEKATSGPDASRLAGRAVFVCYPPPSFDSRVATETLEAYVASLRGGEARSGGDAERGVLALVGEWDGNTADGAFVRLLTKHFSLTRRVALPQWGDTAHELTVWERKRLARDGPSAGAGGGARAAEEGVIGATLPLKSCAWCGGGRVEGDDEAEATTKRNDDEPFLRRCVLCRDDCGTFCSASCARLGAAKHAETHALRLIPTPTTRLIDWSDRGDYVAFRPFAR